MKKAGELLNFPSIQSIVVQVMLVVVRWLSTANLVLLDRTYMQQMAFMVILRLGTESIVLWPMSGKM